MDNTSSTGLPTEEQFRARELADKGTDIAAGLRRLAATVEYEAARCLDPERPPTQYGEVAAAILRHLEQGLAGLTASRLASLAAAADIARAQAAAAGGDPRRDA